MGDIADMMLDGTMCQQCGEFMGDAGGGYAVTCAACSEEASPPSSRWNDGPHIVSNWKNRAQVQVPAKVKVVCPQCSKRVKAVGFYQHMSDAHEEAKR